MINDETIIDGRKVKLSESQKNGVTEFHKSRIAFAIISKHGGGYDIAMNIKDAREHRIYLKEDYNISNEEFETLTRGYIKQGKLMFYISSSFNPVKKELITEQLIKDLLLIAKEEFGNGEYIIGNGLKVGEPGEEWRPQKIMCTYIVGEEIKKKKK